MAAVLLHGVEDGFGLEAGCFEGSARDVAALRGLRYADWSGGVNMIIGLVAGACDCSENDMRDCSRLERWG